MTKNALAPTICEYLSRPDAIGDFNLRGRPFRGERPVGHGRLGFVWRVIDELGQPRAAKFVTYDDYSDKSYKAELVFAAKLEKYPQFARLGDAGIVELDVPQKTKFVCFIQEWVDGPTLHDFIFSLAARGAMLHFQHNQQQNASTQHPSL